MLLCRFAVLYISLLGTSVDVKDIIFADFIFSYAPWCPACQSLKPIWKSFADQWSEELSVSVGLVDINKNPG